MPPIFAMKAALGGLPWKAIGIGALVLIVVIAIASCQHNADKRAAAEAIADNAIAIANNNAELAERQSAARERLSGILAERHTQGLKMSRVHDANRREIINAPATDDGPVAPVLRRQLDSLRRNETDPGNHRD